MVFVAAVQAPVFVLMDDPSPVAQFDVCLEKVRQCRQRDPVGFHLFQRFDKLLAYLSPANDVVTSSPSTSQKERVMPFSMKKAALL